MKEIKFRYRDHFTKGRWKEKSCVVETIDEFERLFGVGKAKREFEILSVRDAE